MRRVGSDSVKPLVLIDTPALYYRAFYSVPDSIVNADGQPVNAVRGVLDAVAQMIRRFDSARVIATMDADWRPAFRTALMPEYKAARVKDAETGTEIPPELAAQLPIITAVLSAAGIPIAEVAGTEADDVIATLAAESTTPVVIVSPDRDLLALLDAEAQVSVLRPRKGGQWQAIEAGDLPELYQVADGTRYRELAALRGDPSDGLPGAPGIGEKTAATLLTNFGSLESVFTAAKAGVKTGGLSPKRAQTLIEHEENLRLTIEVMTCLTDVDHGLDLAALPRPSDEAAVRTAADGQNIARSVDTLLTALRGAGVRSETEQTATAARPAASTQVIPNPGGSKSWASSRLVGFDLETTGVEPETARIVTAALIETSESQRTWLADPGVDIPEAARAVHGITTEYAQANGIPAEQAVRELCEQLLALRRAGAVLVGHNIVYDLSVLDAEVHRHAPDLDLSAIIPIVVDTYVLDKHVEQYRRGKRTLTDTAVRWGVSLLDAHDAAADALASVEIARAIAGAHPDVAALTGDDIMREEGEWKRAQAADLQAFLRRKRDPNAVVDASWPMTRTR